MATSGPFAAVQAEYDKLKADAHAKVETLTPTQLRSFCQLITTQVVGRNRNQSRTQVAKEGQ
jgi:hypothetical protein